MGARLTKRLASWAFLLFLGIGVGGAEVLVLEQPSGLNTDHSPATLRGGQTPDSENVVTDDGPGLQPRHGFTLCHASSATASWVFPHSNGTRYQIIHSGSVLKADDGSCTFSTTVSTVAASVRVTGAVLGDRFYFANTTDGLKYWTSSAVATASATLTVTQLVAHKGRLWAAGHTSFPRTIFASEFNDGTDWTLVTDPVVTDPAQFVIGGAVDEPLTALYASHKDALVWMKPRSFGSVSGNSRADFTVRTYSDNVGTAYPDSIKDCDGLLRWLGPARTIYEWDGVRLVNIGNQIRGQLAMIGQGDANARNYTITTQSDYNEGTNYQTTNAITAGDVMLSTWTDTDTTTADFNAGSASNLNITNNRVYLSTNNTNVADNDMDNVTTNWDASAGGFSQISGGAGGAEGTNGFARTTTCGQSSSFSVLILDSNSNAISTTGLSSSSTSWAQYSHDLASYVGRWIKLKFVASDGRYIVSETFLCSGATITYYTSIQGGGLSCRAFDLVRGGKSTIFSGTLTSSAFDTSLTSAAWTSSGANWTANSHSISLQTQSSSDGSTWQSAVSWTTGSAPTSDFRKYIRYVATVSTGGTTNGTALPYIDDVTLTARANFGTYVSTSISLGGITSWGSFGANTDTDGGTVTYAIYTDSDTSKTVTNGIPVSGTWVSSQTITDSSIPTISTAGYAFISVTKSITVGSQNPSNHSLVVGWSEGNTTPAPSAWFRQRYWLAVSQNATSNNRVLVFDRNRQWQRYNGINISAINLYNGNLFFGNSAGWYQYETGYSDAGSAIAAYYRTPTLAPGSPNLTSVFNDLQLTTESSAETLTTTYQVNGVTSTDYSLASRAMNTDSGIQNFRLSFPFTQVQQGRNISLKMSVSGTTFWRVLGGTLDYTPDLLPQ